MAKASLTNMVVCDDIIAMGQNDSDIILVSPKHDDFFRITGNVACETFNLLKKGQSSDKIISTLSKKFADAPPEQLEKDVNDFIKKLTKFNILING